MPAGGKQPGAGRPKGGRNTKGPGSSNHIAKRAAAVKANGDRLPHEILNDAANGKCFKLKREVKVYYKTGPNKGKIKESYWEDFDYYPNYAERQDAAKAAAPYYAPKLASKEVSVTPSTDGITTPVMLVPMVNMDDWEKSSAKSQAELKKTVVE